MIIERAGFVHCRQGREISTDLPRGRGTIPLLHHMVRYSVLGAVARFQAVPGGRFARGARVVCRTTRGLETGEVLSPLEPSAAGNAVTEGTILRPVTVADDLLLARLERHKETAVAACGELLAARGLPAVLMDAELLFDGQTLLFYFLGETTPELDALTHELAETYEASVQFRKFTEALTVGCGPDCGTEAATGGGCGSTCSSCAVSGACGIKRAV